MTLRFKNFHYLSLFVLASCASNSSSIEPEDAIDLICKNCTIGYGAALVGNCPQGYAELKIKESQLTVKYTVNCGSGPQSATESGMATDLKVVKSPNGNYLQGKWTDRGDMLADADLKLSFNENWEFHQGKQLTLALFSSGNWEYQFSWTESDSAIDELCKMFYSESELASISNKREQRIPLDYSAAGDIEILGFILNSKWRNNKGDATIEFDTNTNTLSFNCDTDYGNQTYSLGNLRFEEEFNRYETYQNLNFFSKGFWVDYFIPYYDSRTLTEEAGLILENTAGRIYFDDGGFFTNYGPKENKLDDSTLRQILNKLKERNATLKAEIEESPTMEDLEEAF